VVVVVVIVGGLGAVLIVNSRHSTPDPNKVINLALEPDQPMPADFKTLGSSYDYQIGVPVGWTIVPVSDAAIQRMIAQRPGDEGYRRTVEQFAASMRNSGSLLALAPRRGAFVDNVIIDERSTAATGISNLSEQRVRSELEASPTNVSNIAIERLVINRRPVLHVSYSLGSTGTVGNQYLVVAHGKAFDVTVTAAAADAPVARQIAQTFVVR
jgi:hypothetical protein